MATTDRRDDTLGSVKDKAGRVLYVANRFMGYDGDEIERGQVFGLKKLRNDEQLRRLGYVRPLLTDQATFPCRKCAKVFATQVTREAHGQAAHEKTRTTGLDVPFSPRGATVDDTAAAAALLERRQAEDDAMAPLRLDKTEASQRA